MGRAVIGRATGILDLKSDYRILNRELNLSRQVADLDERGESPLIQRFGPRSVKDPVGLLQRLKKNQFRYQSFGGSRSPGEIITSRELEREKRTLLDAREHAQVEHCELDQQTSEIIQLQVSSRANQPIESIP